MAQRARPWSEVSAQLEGLLSLLAAPWTTAGSDQLNAEFDELTSCFPGLAPSTAAERQQLSRGLIRAAALLNGLPEQTEQLRPLAPLVVFGYLNVACMLLAFCTQLAPGAGLQPADLQRLCGCTRLVLTSGTEAAWQGIEQLRRGEACDPGWKGLLFSGQIALNHCVQLAGNAGWLPWFAARIASPAPLASWIAATVAGLELLRQRYTQQAPSFLDHSGLAALCTGIYLMLSCPEFDPHFAALEPHRDLGPSLLRLLLAYIPALAVGLQLPADRRPEGCNWLSAAHAAAVFMCEAVQQAQGQQLFTPADRSGEAHRSMEKLLRSAVLLVQHVPLPTVADLGSAAAAQQLECASRLAMLLGRVAAGGMLLQPPLLPADKLLALLPKLRGMLQCAARQGAAGGQLRSHCLENIVAGIGAAWAALQGQLRRQLNAGQQMSWTAAELQQWCGCAAEMLRLVPVAAEAAGAAGMGAPASSQEARAAGPDAATVAPSTLAETAVDLASEVARAAQDWSGALEDGSPHSDSLATAEAALKQLNMVGCRLVHFASSGAAASLQDAPLQGDAALVVAYSLTAASGLLACNWPLDKDDSRRLHSISLASWEALLVVHEQQPLPPFLLLPAMVVLAARFPVLIPDTRFQTIWAEVSEARWKRRDEDVLEGSCGFLATWAARHPLIAAHALLTSSVPVERHIERGLPAGWAPVVSLLKKSAASAAEDDADSSTPQSDRQLLAAVRQCLKGVERAEAGQQDVLPPARRLAAALLDLWRRPEQAAVFQLDLAQAAATRSCAYLHCANLGGGGGPAAGQGEGSQRCSACHAVWYCGTACSHADWRAGHRRVCRALGEARAAEKERRRQAAAAAEPAEQDA